MSIEELIQQTQKLTAEVQTLTRAVTAMKQTPLIPAPVPVPTPAPASHAGLPPRPGGPGSGAANHLSNILNGGSGIPTNHITPEEQATRDAHQRAIQACNEATRAMAMATVQRIVTPKPNLQDFLADPLFRWPGYDIIAAAQAHPGPGTHVPRPI